MCLNKIYLDYHIFCMWSVVICLFFRSMWENLVSHRYAIGNGGMFSKAFHIIVIFLFDTIRKVNKWDFLKINWNVESETIYKLFYHCHIKVHWPIMHFEWIFYQCRILQHCASVIWKTLVDWIRLIFQMLTHFIILYQKITFNNVTHH